MSFLIVLFCSAYFAGYHWPWWLWAFAIGDAIDELITNHKA